MLAKELAEFLLKHPDAPIYYEDSNYGGPSEEFNFSDIKAPDTDYFKTNGFLIRTPFWTEVD